MSVLDWLISELQKLSGAEIIELAYKAEVSRSTIINIRRRNNGSARLDLVEALVKALGGRVVVVYRPLGSIDWSEAEALRQAMYVTGTNKVNGIIGARTTSQM